MKASNKRIGKYAADHMFNKLQNAWVTESVKLSELVWKEHGEEGATAEDIAEIQEAFAANAHNAGTLARERSEIKIIVEATPFGFVEAVNAWKKKYGALPGREPAKTLGRKLRTFGFEAMDDAITEARKRHSGKAAKKSVQRAATTPEQKLLAAFAVIESAKLDSKQLDKKLIEWRSKHMKGLRDIAAEIKDEA